MSKPSLILASASPRRRDILIALGLEFEILAADVDETRQPGETPEAMVVRLAADKAAALDRVPGRIVIGADTAVVLGDTILGKPRDEADALDMLRQLSGRRHRVLTGVAVLSTEAAHAALSVTEVDFREISRDEAQNYWQSGEPRGKAGAYAIQGRGGVFVERLEGSYSGVVGLPVFETASLLQRAGLDLLKQ